MGKPLNHDNMTLNEVLRALGYTSRPVGIMYDREILRDGQVVFTGDAGPVWDWLHATGQIAERGVA